MRSCARAPVVKGLLEVFETVANGAVDDGVADGRHDAPEDRGVDDLLHGNVLASGLFERLDQLLASLRVKRIGGTDLCDRLAPLLGGPSDEPVNDVGEVPGTAGTDHERHQGGRD